MPRSAVDENGQFLAKGLYGERFPSGIDGPNYGKPKNLKSATINPADIGAGSYAMLRDPYNFPMKIRFEESYRCDPVVRAAINRKVSFILGKELKTQFDLIETFAHPNEARAAINIFMRDQEYLKAKSEIDKVMRKTKFQQKLKGAVIQSKVYGRSALLVESDDYSGFPTNIKILNSKLLGQVRINEFTWALQQIQYNTNSRGLNDPYNFLDASDIVYFTNLDYHVSPYTVWYGLSDIEPIQHVSEVNRIMNEEDLKETNKSMWAGFGLIKVPTTRNIAEVSAFLSQFQAGKWTAISQDVICEVHELQKDLASLLTERNENEKLILRTLNVPAALLGFEDIQNFATLQEVMLAWKESVVEEERTWINNTLDTQWFDTLFAIALNMSPEEFDDLSIRLKLAFEDVSLETLKDKVLAVLPLYEAGLLPGEKVLEILGFDDVLDQMQQLQGKIDQGQAEFISALAPEDRPAAQQVLGVGQSTPRVVQYPAMSPKSLLTTTEKAHGRPTGNPQDNNSQ